MNFSYATLDAVIMLSVPILRYKMLPNVVYDLKEIQTPFLELYKNDSVELE